MKDNYKNSIQTLKQLLFSSAYCVFLGGAGVSTDSGIPDFRGTNGMYKGGSGNEYYLSRQCLKEQPSEFYAFFRENMQFPDAVPNETHKALAKLESEGVVKTVITQNIDGLHRKAGSRNVIEIHGDTDTYYCMRCGAIHDREYVASTQDVPLCRSCNGVVRPSVTLYGEKEDEVRFSAAQREIAKSDLLIVGGTSLMVEPTASLVTKQTNGKLVIINYSPTPYDDYAELVINASLSQVFGDLMR